MESTHASQVLEALPQPVWVLDMSAVARALRTWRDAGVADVGRHVAENPAAVEAIRRQMDVLHRNTAALQMVGALAEHLLGGDTASFPDGEPGFAACIVAIAEGHRQFSTSTCLLTPSGESIPVVMTFGLSGGDLTHVPATFVDRRERMRFEAEAEQVRTDLAETMEAARLGELAGSIAHEVNQPLSAISGYASAARRWLRRSKPDLAEAEAAISEVIRASTRASEVIASVKSLFGRTERARADVVVDAIAADAAEIAATQIRGETGIALDLRGSGASIRGDRVLLQQAIGNLLGNAMQAVNEQCEGHVLLSTCTDGERFVLSVEDNGPGFSEEATEQAFRGFYTTKPTGMGLGLSITRSAVESHGGSIAVARSEQLGGAKVTISLPLDVGSVERSEDSL
jgi:signal transduction histidine kinase